ncbi:MAG: hypothetical protein IJ131_03655 [Eggerthellaceae bacterium]|nr:hypothetical protein [Eggerthellaceae bacterium]
MFTFNPDELKVTGQNSVPTIYGPGDTVTPKWNTPITPKENMIRMLEKDQMPLWVPNQTYDNNAVQPMVMPDAHARTFGGVDWFGIDWTYDELTSAAMVTPGFTLIDDICDWRDVKFPDLNEIDWEADFKANYEGRLDPDRLTYFVIVNGMFERTADMIGFEDAFCALLTDQDELDEFWDQLDEWHMKLIDIAKEVYGADMILFHDDMGTQKSTFFSPDLYKDLLSPHYKKITDHIHNRGMYTCRHSCGNIGTLLQHYIDEGWDAWEGQDSGNDKVALINEFPDLAQCTLYIVDPSLSDEEAVADVRQHVDELGVTGRYACRLRDPKAAEREVDLAEELYRYSRIKLAEQEENAA